MVKLYACLYMLKWTLILAVKLFSLFSKTFCCKWIGDDIGTFPVRRKFSAIACVKLCMYYNKVLYFLTAHH